MHFDDLHDQHIVDQALAEAIELGSMRAAGKTPEGDDLFELTAKGVLSTAFMYIQALQATTDAERRDFTEEEKADILGHLKTVMEALERK